MSQSDQKLVQSLGLPISYFAKALGVSRQAVSKGIKLKDNYFSPPALSRILKACREEDASLYEYARGSVRDIYVRDAERILAAASEHPVSTLFDSSSPGEFTLVCGDLHSFIRDSDACHQQLCQVVSAFEEQDGHLELMVNTVDRKWTRIYSEKSYDSKKVSRLWCDFDLSILPTYLVRIGPDLTTTMFGCSGEGFVGISQFEVGRIRRTIQQLQARHQTHGLDKGN